MNADRLVALPKVHVHAHLDGCYPVDAVRALAAARGRDFARPTEFADVWTFFDAYGTVPALVDDLDDLVVLCRALVAAEAALGVRYLEPAIEPQLYAPRLGTLAEVTDAIVGALQAAASEFGIDVGANLTINTDEDEAIADELIQLAIDRAGAGVTALGTAGFIEPAGLHRFAAAARGAIDAGLPIVAHAGQVGGPDSVLEALDVLGATRISHGIRAVESDALLRRMAIDRIVCDVCPVSNVGLGVADSLAAHPAPRLIRAGVPITLNADDSLWFDTTVVDQYAIASTVWQLDDAAIAGIAGDGLLITGMQPSTRADFTEALAQWRADDTTRHDQRTP